MTSPVLNLIRGVCFECGFYHHLHFHWLMTRLPGEAGEQWTEVGAFGFENSAFVRFRFKLKGENVRKRLQECFTKFDGTKQQRGTATQVKCKRKVNSEYYNSSSFLFRFIKKKYLFYANVVKYNNKWINETSSEWNVLMDMSCTAFL